MSFITVKDLHWGYHKGEQQSEVLSGVNLVARQGEVVALLGRSGSGKSSLLNVLSGILPALRGDVSVAGFSLSAMNEQQRTLFRRRTVGFVYQFFNLIPTLSVSENLELVLELNAQPRVFTRKRVDELLARLGLADKAEDFPDLLSGGEQQRVAIARALIHQPPLLLADEPTGNLDAHSGQQAMTLLIDQAKQLNACLIIVTHSTAVSEQADRVLYLEEGQLHPPEGVLTW